jgi:hypothetical protein
MCKPHFNTLRTSWYNIKKSIENYLACLNITMVGKLFQNTWTKGCHVSISMAIVKYLLMYKKILIHHSHVVWPTHSIYHYFFTHNGLMVTYKKLAFSLHLLSRLNYNQIIICHEFSGYVQLKIVVHVGNLFQNTKTKGYHIFMSMVIVR